MSRKNKQQTKYRSAGRRRVGWWMSGVIILIVVLAAGFWLWPTHPESPEPDLSKLAGQWVRIDGGYMLEFGTPEPNGELKASYFNPNPINISRAKWNQRDGVLGVFVELRDTGYPGSTYTLSYQPIEDQLVGSYFQAVIGQEFDVAFKRSR